MLRRLIGLTLVACGALALFAGLSSLASMGVTPALAQVGPSPRPTLPPTPPPDSRERRTAIGDAGPMGHITGTVIDLSSGAPVPGVNVLVGVETVPTDSNGNYDHWVPAGVISVTLTLAQGQGTPAQEMLMVEVRAGETTVQHLGFRSSPAQAPTSTVLPAATPMPVAPPAETAAPVVAMAPSVAMAPASPARLPVTSATAESAAWLWIMVGAGLLLGGSLILSRRPRPAYRPAPADALLTQLLTVVPAPARTRAANDEELLARLLERRG
jgi:hypothetical protein